MGIVDGEISVRDEELNSEIRHYKPYYQGLLLPRLLRLDEKAFFMFRKEELGGTRFVEQITHAEDLLFL